MKRANHVRAAGKRKHRLGVRLDHFFFNIKAYTLLGLSMNAHEIL
jgi:hypothetical protein